MTEWVWDDTKHDSNIKEHGLDFVDARDRFDWDTAIIGGTYPSKTGRARFMAIGFLDDDLVSFVFSPLGSEAISTVSLRSASHKERKRYEESQESAGPHRRTRGTHSSWHRARS